MRRILWFLLLPLAVWAQLGDNTVTVSASRPLANLQPDQAVFSVYVSSPVTASLNDVLAALAGTGISAANLSGAFTPAPTAANTLTQWTFSLTAPLANLGSTLAALNAAAAGSAMQVNYSLSVQVSPQLQASQQCPYALLVQDAQAQAQTLVTAAGASVGPILSVSDGSTVGAVSGSFTIGFTVDPANRVGDFLLSVPSPSPSCTMTRPVQPDVGQAGQAGVAPAVAG